MRRFLVMKQESDLRPVSVDAGDEKYIRAEVKRLNDKLSRADKKAKICYYVAYSSNAGSGR